MDQAAKAPPVDIDPMSWLFNDFGRQVLRSSTNGGGCFFGAEDFRESEISEFDVADPIDDDVFWF